MKISIVTVGFNSAKTIKHTIDSVLMQTHDDVEYIIVDGGSTDGTMDIVDSYGDAISKKVSEPDKGIYDAMNKGLRMATGDVIGILNSDDFYADADVLRDVYQRFESEVSECVYADLEYVDAVHTDKVIRYWKSGKWTPSSFLNGWMPPHPTFFVKRQAYEEYGNYDTAFRSSADYELMLRFLHKNKLSVSYLPRVIVKMRTGGQSNASVSNRVSANKEDQMAWKKNGLSPRFYTIALKPIRKISQYFRRSN